MAATQEWHYAKDNQQFGPVTAAELRWLASTGELSASDLVWKEGMADWKQADAIKGLFPTASATTAPPSIPSKSSKAAKLDDNPGTANVTEAVKTDFSDLMSSAKRAKDITVAHARKTQLSQLTLPNAYLSLGKDVLANERFRGEFGDLFDQIAAKNDEIAKVKAAAKEHPPATDLKGKVKSGAAHLMAQGYVTKLGFQRDSLIRDLGKKAFESHGDAAGPEELVKPIQSGIEELAGLEAQVQQLSSSAQRPIWRRLRVAALRIVTGGLMVVALTHWMYPKSARQRVAALGTPIQPDHSFEKEMSGIQQQLKKITQEAEQSATDAKKREDLLEAKRELEFAKSKLERERAARERQEKETDELAKRKRESSVQEVQEQEDRKKMAERFFDGISLDPSKCVVLSDSLKNSGATVELRGKDYTTLRRLHEKKDWIGLINYLSSGDGVKYDQYPPAYVIERAIRRLADLDLFILVKTNLEFGSDESPMLCTIQFPLSLDRSFHYGSLIDTRYDFTRHPDGIGYLRRWNVANGIAIVRTTKLRHEGEDFARSTSRKFQEFCEALEKKVQLGELDDETFQIRVTAEMVRLYEETRRWAQSR